MSGSRRSFSVALAQFAVSADPGSNLGKAEAAMAEAARRGAHAVCLPELFRTPYFCQVEDAALFDLAEPADGPTTAALRKAARSLSVAVVAPIFERRAPGLYHNSAVVIDSDGEVAGLYRKMHIPDDPAFYEKFYFTPGDLGFRSFNTKAGRLGVLVCWDQWYPEGARLTALAGAEILFYPTAIGWHPREKEAFGAAQRDAWMTVQRGHAVANGVYVAAVNRVGREVPPSGGDGLEFWGTSFLCDPQGQILAQGSTDREELLVGEVDRERIEDVRRNWPFLRDRRTDAYGGVTERFLDGGDPFRGGK